MGTKTTAVPRRAGRLANLLFTLAAAPEPLSRRAVCAVVPGYPPDERRNAQRGALVRDIRDLRTLGYGIEAVPTDDRVDQEGYRLVSDAPPHFEPAELSALRLVHGATRVGWPLARAGWSKLGIEPSRTPVRIDLACPPALPVVLDAVGSARLLVLSYGRRRVVAPLRVACRNGRWYLLGREADHRERTYRVDRIEGVPELSGVAPHVPSASVAVIPKNEPWRAGREDPVLARVRVDPPLSRLVAAWYPGTPIVGMPDGTAIMTCEVRSIRAFRDWLLGLAPHARVLGPTELRSDVVDWLASTSTGQDAPPVLQPESLRRPPRRPARPERAIEVLALVIAALAVLERSGPLRVEALARHLGADPAGLGDLLGSASCWGPNGADPYRAEFLDIHIHPGAGLAAFRPSEWARRVLRLTNRDTLAIAAGIGVARPVVGQRQALGDALDRLGAALPAATRLDATLDAPRWLSKVLEATRRRRRVIVEYFAAGTDEIRPEVVQAWHVFAHGGRWYLYGYSETFGRTAYLRVDRILDMEVGEPYGRRGPRPPEKELAFLQGRTCTISLPASARWVIEYYPFHRYQEDDGRLVVDLPVRSESFLARLLLRVGPDAQVLAPDEYRDLGKQAAHALLAHYETDPSAA